MLSTDEPRYAAVGREMAVSGDWITPRLWGNPWFEKPALLYWLIALGNRAGLDADLAPRLPVALVSVWFLVFYFLRMKREFGERSAWISSSILATSAGWLGYSHVAVTDIPLAVTFAASTLLSLPWLRSGGRRGLIFAGALLGLAVLAKGLVPLILALPLLWAGRQRWRDLFAFGAAALAVAAPWYWLCYARNGQEFINTFFWQHHFGRFLTRDLQHVQPWWFYIPILAGLMFPWTPMLAALRGIDWQEPRRFFLISQILFGLVFFSLSSNKLPGYVLPLLPSIAALAGIQLAVSPVRFVLPFSALLLAATPVVIAVLPEAVAAGLRRSSIDGVNWTAVLLFAVAAIVIVWIERYSFTFAFRITTVLAAGSAVWIVMATFPALDRSASARLAWRAMLRSGQPVCLDDVHRRVRYGLNYYAGRELPRCVVGGND
ncbi:MAG: glycosyltransferase family 39 protein [Bryobacteraceae bacterium]|nr:glycosyltransferase family 39 protein [Bryobacteraceae bacterium]